jgi:hypothetical protein
VAAARATVKDWEMIYDDVALGFVLAGLVGAFVPATVWEGLFGGGGSPSAVLTTAVLAALVGALTVMCSVGNVPFALVLWRNGLPYGGVLTFIYADLLIPPLVNLYRKYYGARLAAAVTVALFVAAVVGGVVVGAAVGGLGLAPPPGTTGGTVGGGYTALLNLAFTPLFLGQVYVAWGPSTVRRRLRRGLLALVRTLQAAVVAVDCAFLTGWVIAVTAMPPVYATWRAVRTTVQALVAVADREIPPGPAAVAAAGTIVAAGRAWRRLGAVLLAVAIAAAGLGWRVTLALARAVADWAAGSGGGDPSGRSRDRPVRTEGRRMLAAGLRTLDRTVERLRDGRGE